MNNLILLSILCAAKLYDFPESYKPSKEFAIIYKLNEKFVNEAQKTPKLFCHGWGGGGTGKNKHTHTFYFAHYEEKDIDAAREMIIDLVDKAVLVFNSSEEYQQYLKEGPYSYKNFDICLFFRKPDGSFGETEKFSGCCFYRGQIQYTNRLIGDESILYKETYKEAKAKLADKAQAIAPR